MSADDTSILAHILNRFIVVVSPCSRRNGASRVGLTTHAPLPGKKARAKHHRLHMEEDFAMCYVSHTRSVTREHANIPDLIKNEKLISIQFHGAHYEGLSLNGTPVKDPAWPLIESHNTLHPSVDKKLCPMCNELSHAQEAAVCCSLCQLWIHCDDDVLCQKKLEKY